MSTSRCIRTTASTCAVGALGVVMVGALAGPAAGAQHGEATLYIVQGLPDEEVDISLDGDVVAEDVPTAEIAGPFTVPAGRSAWTFTGSDGEVLAENSVQAAAGDSSDVVLHLPSSSGGEPVLTAFKNDLSAVPDSKAALTVAHTAAVPPADIVVNGEVLFANVANGEALSLVVPVDSYSVKIVPTGESEPVLLGPLDLSVEGGSLNRVFAVGDPDSDTMNVVTHVLGVEDEGSEKPDMVNTGTGGQATMLRRVVGSFAGLLP